jgi:hypothetical protein
MEQKREHSFLKIEYQNESGSQLPERELQKENVKYTSENESQ